MSIVNDVSSECFKILSNSNLAVYFAITKLSNLISQLPILSVILSVYYSL